MNTVKTFRPADSQKHTAVKWFVMLCLLIIGYLTIVTDTANGATYYLDAVNGNDANPGTSGQPWQTINRAKPTYSGSPKVQAGDIVYIRTGEYGDWVWTPHDFPYYTGDPNEPLPENTQFITYKAQADNEPNFSKIEMTYYDPDHTFLMPFIFDGITTSRVRLAHVVGMRLKNMTIYGTSPWVTDGGVYVAQTGIQCNNDIVIENCKVHTFLGGIKLWGNNITVKDCEIYNIGCDHLTLEITKNTLIEHNYIHDTNRQHAGEHPDGICLAKVTNASIKRNILCRLQSQGIGFDGDDNKTDVLIENNLFYDVWSSTIMSCQTTNLTMRNNTIVANSSAEAAFQTLFGNHSYGEDSNSSIYNNIFICWYKEDTVQWSNHNNNIYVWHPDNPTGENNSYVYNGGDSVASKILALADLPNLFTDPDANDFTLKAGSRAINFGTTQWDYPSTDLLGNPRSGIPDAGCYEYVPGSPGPSNNAPAATAQSVTTSEDVAKSITLSGTDVENSSLTYSIVTQPAHGTLTGTAPNITYTPSANYNGSDSFTFKVNDGTVDSATATVSITITAVNDAPVATAQSVTTSENAAKSITLSGTDVENSSLTYSIVTQPAHGTLTGTAPNLTYTPVANYSGSDSFTFKVNDGTVDSATATVSITITAVNDTPAATPQSVTTNEDTAKSITLSGTDTDGNPLTYSMVSSPGHGTLTGSAPNLTYTPVANYSGSDSFTFKVNDGTVDSATATVSITITAVVDTSPPSVTNFSPAANSIQVPLNRLITLHIVDSGRGVNGDTVTITVNSNVVYTGNTTDYSSQYGHCRRKGTEADYTFIYQPAEAFEFDQTVTVTVNAADLGGNTMAEYSYSFKTEMRSFGKNKKVNSNSDALNEGGPVTVRDSGGNIWAAWHSGQAGSRDIYVGKLAAGAEGFGSSVKVTSNTADQCNAAVAIGSDNKLYLAWQDNRRGNWDIYISTSTDGVNWSAERLVTDSNDNQVNPAIAVDGLSPNRCHIIWQDDRGDNQNIFLASSSNGFVTKTVTQITSNSSDQTEPAIAADSDNTVYVVWTDTRGGSNDIYGAASNNGLWTNVAIVNNAYSQSSPAIATEAAGSVLHLLWVDQTSGNQDIYYATSNALPNSPLTGSSIIDDTSGADQLSPTIVTTGSTGNNLKVFACWQDRRNIAGSSTDTDLYFAQVNAGDGTNVFVGDDSTNANQGEPAMGIDIYGYPSLIWADSRNTNADIYYAGSTFVESTALTSKDVSAATGATVGTEPSAISSTADVSVVVPAGAYSCDVKITISRVRNPQKLTLEYLNVPYEFGPSGIDFAEPVTITIPYEVPAAGSSASAYWYNLLTGTLSQQGITDVQTIVISPTLHALQFKTTHFTQFIVGGVISGVAAAGGGGGGGGGCSMTSSNQGSIMEFFLPYIGLAVVMIMLKLRDKRNKKVLAEGGV